MYHVRGNYQSLNKSDLFETLEEAIEDAEKRASTTFDEYTYYVSKVEAVVKTELIKQPVKTAIVSEESGLLQFLSEESEPCTVR